MAVPDTRHAPLALTCALVVVLLLLAPLPACAQSPLRIASFHTELSRKGPGLLLKATREGDPQVEAVARLIARAAPDIIALQDIDYDYHAEALTALAERITEHGHALPYRFALRPNTGMPTGLDMEGDGRLGTPRDAQGYGHYSGQHGMAILSRYPIRTDQAKDYSALLWADMPDPMVPTSPDGAPFPSPDAFAAQRLSSTGHWAVPVDLGEGQELMLLTYAATPPLFDKDEDRNGKRNHDETRFWTWLMDGAFGPPPNPPLVLLGLANVDPHRGQGRRAALTTLLADPRFNDPHPTNSAGEDATAEFARAGLLRLSYILPSSDLQVTGSGILQDPAASRHRLVYVDLDPR